MAQSKEALLQAISDDRALASALLFSHRHSDVTPPFHVEIMDLWRSADEIVCIEGFRESAKSTLSEEFIALEACFGNFKYAYIIGETYTKACQRLDSIKFELNTNSKIRELFGDVGKSSASVWKEDVVILANSTKLQAIGWEQEIRGEKHLSYRPDRAYLDDVENKERVRDSSVVQAGWIKFWKELRPAMDVKHRKIRITGTPLANDCLVNRFKASPDCVSKSFPICNGDMDDPSTQSLWPERYPMEWIRSERDKFARAGTLREFNQEYLLIAAQTAGKPFTDDMIVCQDIAPVSFLPKKVIIDPARTTDIKKSDETGHVVVSRSGSTIYVHESNGQFLKPDEIVNLAFDTSDKFDDAEVTIEKNSLDEWLLQPMRAKMLSRGKSLSLNPVNAPQDRDKNNFILGLQPFFKAKEIVFIGNPQKHAKLIGQILNFPSGKKDVINALAYTLRVFSGMPLYPDFSERNIRYASQPGKNALLLLGANASSTEVACVLSALDGSHLTVLRDWCSPLSAMEAIREVAIFIRMAYPGRTVATWVPADVYDQVGRNPLIAALKANNLRPSSSDHATMLRGTLADMIRTDMHGRRLFCVNSEANGVLQALAYGYNYPAKQDGSRVGDPERNAARTLMECVEALTYPIHKMDTATHFKVNSVNASGTPYMSALGKK